MPVSSPPFTVSVLSSGIVKLDPSGIFRLSPSPMVKSSCKVTSPYTVPVPLLKTIPVPEGVTVLEFDVIPPVSPLAFTMVLPQTGQTGCSGARNPADKLKVYARIRAGSSRGQAAAVHSQRGGLICGGQHSNTIAVGRGCSDLSVLDCQGSIAVVALDRDSWISKAAGIQTAATRDGQAGCTAMRIDMNTCGGPLIMCFLDPVIGWSTPHCRSD